MFKLSLRERVKFWWKNKIWLRKITSSITCGQYGMMLYKGKDGSIWTAGKFEGKVQIIQISTIESCYDDLEECFYQSYNSKEEIGYIFGKKGIFYKQGRNTSWKCIYTAPDITGMIVNMGIGIVCIFRKDEKDDVYRIKDGYISKESLVKDKKIARVNGSKLKKNNIECTYCDMEMLVQNDNNTYSYYFITANEFYNPKLVFETMDESKEFCCYKELVKVYSTNYGCDVLATLVNGREKVHYRLDEKCCNKFMSLKDNYYLAVFLEDSKCHLLRYVNEEKVENLGIVPKGKLTFVAEILGVIFYTIKTEEGITLLAISDNELKLKFYEKATGIKITRPVLFENGNVMELKPIAVYEKIVKN